MTALQIHECDPRIMENLTLLVFSRTFIMITVLEMRLGREGLGKGQHSHRFWMSDRSVIKTVSENTTNKLMCLFLLGFFSEDV